MDVLADSRDGSRPRAVARPSLDLDNNSGRPKVGGDAGTGHFDSSLGDLAINISIVIHRSRGTFRDNDIWAQARTSAVRSPWTRQLNGEITASMLTECVEGIARDLLRSAGADETERTRPSELVRALLGPGSLYSVHARSLPGDGSLAIVDGEPRVYIRQRLSPVRKRWAICHELAEWWLWREGVRDSGIENAADGIAAALLLPRLAFLRAQREVGPKYHQIAGWFDVTESCAALRSGEVTGEPLALVAPTRVRIRGADFVWGSEEQIRALARKPNPWVHRARLSDDRRRLALTAIR